VAVIAAVLLATLAVAPGAGADLRPRSTHAFLVGKHKRLALPLPLALATPKLTRDKQGRIRVAVRIRFAVANWLFRKGVGHDRALVTVVVSRRLETTGPDPSKPLYRRTYIDVRGLSRRLIDRSYQFLLPKSVSNLLVSKGAFAGGGRRRGARRLLWIDVQQDRDFKRVDGRYDWREGTAFGAADTIRRRNPLTAHAAAGEQNPYGTLSITNNTAAGVYCQSNSQCPLVNQSTGLPGSLSGTTNSPTYSVPLAVNGGAVQCFDQGTNGSDPAGFANDNASGTPQPYGAGTASAAPSGSALPSTTGTTVTEGIAADYSLAWAGNQQTASDTGAIMGGVKIGLQVIKGAAGSFISPGAVITGILGIFEYFLENSCKESGNYFNITAAETQGAAVSATYNAQTEIFQADGGTGSTPPGFQLNPSGLTFNGAHLWLNTLGVVTGLADNICDCSHNVGNNAIDLSWENYDPCITSPASQCSLQPPIAPIVTSQTGSINCGQANQNCPVPAADWPPTNGRQQIYAGLSGGSTGVLWSCDPFNAHNCSSAYQDGGNNLNAMIYANNVIYMGDSNATLFTCGPTISGVCNTGQTIGSHNGITAIAYGDGYVYAGVYTGSGVNEGLLYRCNAATAGPNGCTQIDSLGNHTSANDMVFANGELYVARSDGVLWECNPTSVNACSVLDSTKGPAINAIAYANGYVYAARSDGVMWQCSGTTANSCGQNFNTAAAPITSLVYASNGYLYAGVPEQTGNASSGLVWQCSATQANSCATLTSAAGSVTELAFANNALYYGTSDSAYLFTCGATAPASCQQLDVATESQQYISALVAAPPG
jgi:hypothetical protein